MQIVRLNKISVADAEQFLAALWRLLEEHRLGAPKLEIETTADNCLDMRLAFSVIADLPRVRRILMRSRWAPFLKPDRADDALASAERFRLRTEECRTAADGMRHSSSRDTMRRIAENYELLADSTDQSTGLAPSRKTPTS